jgi:hypothetical protein
MNVAFISEGPPLLMNSKVGLNPEAVYFRNESIKMKGNLCTQKQNFIKVFIEDIRNVKTDALDPHRAAFTPLLYHLRLR